MSVGVVPIGEIANPQAQSWLLPYLALTDLHWRHSNGLWVLSMFQKHPHIDMRFWLRTCSPHSNCGPPSTNFAMLKVGRMYRCCAQPDNEMFGGAISQRLCQVLSDYLFPILCLSLSLKSSVETFSSFHLRYPSSLLSHTHCILSSLLPTANSALYSHVGYLVCAV